MRFEITGAPARQEIWDYPLVALQPGIRTPALAEKMGTSPKNVERWLKQLKAAGHIEFRGATKTGGYYPCTH